MIDKVSNTRMTKKGSGLEQTTPSLLALQQDVSAVESNIVKSNLKDLIYPSYDGGWRDIIRGGWTPPLNQQWGGHLCMLPDGSWGDSATGAIEDNSYLSFGYNNTYQYAYMTFKVAKAITVKEIRVKLYKTANPTGNAQLSIYDNNAGVPNAAIANGAATAIAGTTITSNTSGEWYTFSFSTPPSLSANTVYHIVLSSSAANSTTNYFGFKGSTTGKYPHGVGGKGTNVPAWAARSEIVSACFVVVPVAVNQFLQQSGQFDCKLQGSSTLTPIDQNDYVWRKMIEFFDAKSGTILIRGSAWTKDRTIMDMMYGFDHDRMVIRSNVTTGYAQLDHYDSAGVKHTITGTTDISTGYHDVAIVYRFMNDGNDYLYLYVDGVSQGSPITAHSFLMDNNFKELGTATLMGGFGVAPAMTAQFDGASLPSAATPAWTYAGTATEGSHAVSVGGKLYTQIVGSTDTAYWEYAATLSNANGWFLEWKDKTIKDYNTTGYGGLWVGIKDGSKQVWIYKHTYFLDITLDGGSTYKKYQLDCTKENVFCAIGKGSDFYLYCNGNLIVDGTGLMVNASVTNKIYFGDGDATASANTEDVIDYIKWYNTAIILPEYTGGALSELAVWSGNMSTLLPILYNAGSPISVKEYCGVEGNYVKRMLRSEFREAVVQNASTTASYNAHVLTPDMECFMYGDKFEVEVKDYIYSSDGGTSGYTHIYIDGVMIATTVYEYVRLDANPNLHVNFKKKDCVFGLHKIEKRWGVNTNTLKSYMSRSLSAQEVE